MFNCQNLDKTSKCARVDALHLHALLLVCCFLRVIKNCKLCKFVQALVLCSDPGSCPSCCCPFWPFQPQDWSLASLHFRWTSCLCLHCAKLDEIHLHALLLICFFWADITVLSSFHSHYFQVPHACTDNIHLYNF